jgi:hypothetical protein
VGRRVTVVVWPGPSRPLLKLVGARATPGLWPHQNPQTVKTIQQMLNKPYGGEGQYLGHTQGGQGAE